MEVPMLIIAILSLIATVAVAFVIFFLQARLERNSREKAKQMEDAIRKRDLANQARIFLLDNANEIEYLTLAQIATAKKSARKIYSDGSGRYTHKRKLYGIFHRCELDLQKEIIRQAKFIDYEFYKYDIEKLISSMIDMFEKDARSLGIMRTDFLYDGAKYFHRGLERWGNKTIANEGQFGNAIWNQLLDFIDYQKAEDKEEIFKKLIKSSANRIAKLLPENQIYSRPDIFAEFKKIHKTAPLDYYWHTIAQPADEELCTFIVMEMVRQGSILISREKNENWSISPDYPTLGTYEDLYYATVLTLYGLYYDQVKNLEKLRTKSH